MKERREGLMSLCSSDENRPWDFEAEGMSILVWQSRSSAQMLTVGKSAHCPERCSRTFRRRSEANAARFIAAFEIPSSCSCEYVSENDEDTLRQSPSKTMKTVAIFRSAYASAEGQDSWLERRIISATKRPHGNNQDAATFNRNEVMGRCRVWKVS